MLTPLVSYNNIIPNCNRGSNQIFWVTGYLIAQFSCFRQARIQGVSFFWGEVMRTSHRTKFLWPVYYSFCRIIIPIHARLMKVPPLYSNTKQQASSHGSFGEWMGGPLFFFPSCTICEFTVWIFVCWAAVFMEINLF